MNSGAGIRTGEKILLAEILRHYDTILEALGLTNSDSVVVSVGRTMEEQHIMIGYQFSSNFTIIQPLSIVSMTTLSDAHGSLPTMNSSAGIGTQEKILLPEILRSCDSILEALGTTNSGDVVAGVGGTMEEQRITIGGGSGAGGI
jgi:hypothetical protein